MSTASDQITQYLSVGGLFNPEMMNQTQHEAVRDTLIKARDDIQSLERENAALRADKERLDWLSSQKDQPWLYWERPLRLTREAIDAFRKEAQP